MVTLCCQAALPVFAYPLEILLPANVMHLVNEMLQVVLHCFDGVFCLCSIRINGMLAHLDI